MPPDALQDKAELAAFVKFVRESNVRSYLEVGCKFGGSMWEIANAMPSDSRIVGIDTEARPELKETCRQIGKRGYKVDLIVGDSTHRMIIEKARKLGPYDLCLIDANHTEKFVRSDWANYGPMARIVAFHDIAWDQGDRPAKSWKIEVPKVWNEIKNEFKHHEIKLCPTRRDNGFGILWRS